MRKEETTQLSGHAQEFIQGFEGGGEVQKDEKMTSTTACESLTDISISQKRVSTWHDYPVETSDRLHANVPEEIAAHRQKLQETFVKYISSTRDHRYSARQSFPFRFIDTDRKTTAMVAHSS